eukprot:m51a1_g12946 hypothetical protein (80) ;mRNA; r:1233-3123
MQTSCPPDRIQVSEATFAALQGKGYAFQERERLLIKGKGEMNCYVLELTAPPELDGAASLGIDQRAQQLQQAWHFVVLI